MAKAGYSKIQLQKARPFQMIKLQQQTLLSKENGLLKMVSIIRATVAPEAERVAFENGANAKLTL